MRYMMLGCAAFGAVVYLYGTHTITTAFVHSKLRVMSTGEFLLPALAICTLAVAGAVAVLAAGVPLLALDRYLLARSLKTPAPAPETEEPS